jgi:hypothetical protein
MLSLNLSDTGIDTSGKTCSIEWYTTRLEEELVKFTALEHLDLSHNEGLSFLPLGILRIAARLKSFKCDGCSLGLPPQSFFSSPEDNPRLIQQLLEGGASETALNLSAVNLWDWDYNHELQDLWKRSSNVVAVLQLYPALKTLDVSSNPKLIMLSDGMLRIIAGLESFKCDGCKFYLPPRLLNEADKIPGVAQQIIDGTANLSSLESDLWEDMLRVDICQEILQFVYPMVKHLDLSHNIVLSGTGVVKILISFAGM